jgi:hypothetical protein
MCALSWYSNGVCVYVCSVLEAMICACVYCHGSYEISRCIVIVALVRICGGDGMGGGYVWGRGCWYECVYCHGHA